jgi:hypothetical protein
MIDLKNVISLIEIIYLKKVSCIIRKKGGNDKNWSVIFEGENEFKNVKLTDKDIEMVNKFRILSV